jgi:hypothetical protein
MRLTSPPAAVGAAGVMTSIMVVMAHWHAQNLYSLIARLCKASFVPLRLLYGSEQWHKSVHLNSPI